MIESRINSETGNTEAVTPQRITTTMIIDDLENGIGRDGIKEKYNLEGWEVTQMFKHPALKGKKAKKVRKLSFDFVDDTINPNQMDLEDQIKEEEEKVDLLDVDHGSTFDTGSIYHEDNMHDAKVDHAQIKSDPANMNEEELTEYEQEEEDDDNEWN
jgi:hypothetical protein|tara:strand:- start:1418 stop:1888 length:471 start_codon:yes stop_codon:yes gene_type:complete